MKSDRHGVRRDSENDGDLTVCQVLPGDQAEQLLVVGSHPAQRSEGRTRAIVVARFDGVDRAGAEAVMETNASLAPSLLVGDHTSGDRIEPGKRTLGFGGVGKAAPRHDERLRHSVLRVGGTSESSEGKSEDRSRMGLVEPGEGAMSIEV